MKADEEDLLSDSLKDKAAVRSCLAQRMVVHFPKSSDLREEAELLDRLMGAEIAALFG